MNTTLTDAELVLVLKGVEQMLLQWHATPEQIERILGFDPRTAYLSNAIPGDRSAAVSRIGLILYFNRCLKTLYPDNQEIYETWMIRSHRELNDETPLRVMSEEGFEGLMKVRQVFTRQLSL